MKLCINCRHYAWRQIYVTDEVKQRYSSLYKDRQVGDLDKEYHQCNYHVDPVTGSPVPGDCVYERSNVDNVTGYYCGPEGKFYEEKPIK